jgi:uncharacterized protein (TIGR02421 family)
MKLSRLSIDEIVQKINNREQFEAIPIEGGFFIKINKYVPFCCTAIHNGWELRKPLREKINLSDYERWYEEDPNTADFIASMPITIVGLDSRYEYDLNRNPKECIYQEAWGKKIWKKRLTANEIKISLKKHSNYYKVLHALIAKLEALYGACVVYDFHSYNFVRWEREVPLFNLGTELVNKQKNNTYIKHWLNELKRIQLTDIKTSVAENDVFKGRGYNLEFLSANFSNTLVLATEIKKVYCDELNGDIFPKIVRQLQQQFKKAILNNANYFSNSLDTWKYVAVSKLLDKKLSSDLLRIDRQMFSLLRNFELLAAVNPTNARIEKRKFLKNRHTVLPIFKYQPIKINPFSLKQNLFSIQVQQIQDVSIRNLYEAVVHSYTDKIDLIGSLNTRKFLYNSLRYFGRPSKKDLINANYLLYLPEVPGEAKKEPVYDAKEAMEVFKQALNDYRINAKIEFSNRVIAQIMVLNSKRSILLQPDAFFKRKELNAMVEHEIGVHMVTTMNSRNQKLKIFNLGLPVNTQTQEGLAILAEYLSGNITIKRLKKIALRVIIVDMMCSGATFIDCFEALVNEYNIEEEDAFTIVTRIFRGGGYTKDYLYLSGFVKIYKMWEQQNDLTPLLVGKTSLPYYNTIEEMIEREMIEKPNYITKSYLIPQAENNNSIYDYIFSGLKF